MKKIAVGVFIFFMSLSLLILVANNAVANPSKSSDCNSQHDEGDYEIEVEGNQESINVESSTKFTFTIIASGSDLVVEAPDDSRDNSNFKWDDELVKDGDSNDDDASKDEIEVEFSLTPKKDGSFTILIIAREDPTDGSDTELSFIEITVRVGEVSIVDYVSGFFNTFVDHLGVFLGGLALILLSTATVLVLINENKFVKAHGYLAGSSWILTVVNVASIFILNPDSFGGGYDFGFHYSHIILGTLGLITGFLSMLFGIAAERKYSKLLGYFTLLFWWGAFFTGMVLIGTTLF